MVSVQLQQSDERPFVLRPLTGVIHMCEYARTILDLGIHIGPVVDQDFRNVGSFGKVLRRPRVPYSGRASESPNSKCLIMFFGWLDPLSRTPFR